MSAFVKLPESWADVWLTYGVETEMQITRYTDYSLRVLIYLSAMPPMKLARVTDIAKGYGISRNHVVKVVHNLGRLGYIVTRQGRGGGVRLSKSPDKINLGLVVREVENTLDPVNCEATSCPLLPSCRLYSILNQAVTAYVKTLDKYTLADLLSEKAALEQVKQLIPQ